MRISMVLLTFLGCFQAFGCTEAMKLFDLECKAQDRYQKLVTDFKAYSINVTDLKGFKIPKAIGKLPYYSAKNELLNHTDLTLPQNKQWQVWNNGQKFINNLSPIYLEYGDVLKLHKTLFAGRTFFSVGSDLGKLRTNNGVTNPKLTLSCNDKILNDKLLDVLLDYDLKSIEGYPLLTLENITECDDTNFSSADLLYYKGASVKMELTRWLAELNDMMSRYEKNNADDALNPYSYLADMRRWFLAISPFSSGNEEVVNAIIDYSAKRLSLPPLSLNDSSITVFMTVEENRQNSIKKIQESLSFFEGCLFETKMKLISSECSPL